MKIWVLIWYTTNGHIQDQPEVTLHPTREDALDYFFIDEFKRLDDDRVDELVEWKRLLGENGYVCVDEEDGYVCVDEEDGYSWMLVEKEYVA